MLGDPVLRRLPTPLAAVIGLLLGALAGIDPRLAVGAVAAVAVVAAVYLSPMVMLLGVLATEPWSGLLAFGSSTFTIPKLVGLLAMASFLLSVAVGRVRLRGSRELGWAGLFLVVVLLSLMLSPDPSAGVTKAISYALYVGFLGIFLQLVRRRRDVERCMAVYAGSSIGAAAYGLVNFLQGHVHLASGPISDPNDFAQMMAGAFPMVVYFAFNGRRRTLWRVGAFIVAGALLASYSRGALVGLGVVLVWAIVTGRISLPGILAGALTAGLVVGIGFIYLGPLIHERLVQKSVIANQNVASRKAFWSAAERMALDHPILGVGPSRFGAESQRYVVNDPIVLHNPVVHDSYLEILAEDGAIALALYAMFLLATWRSLRAVRRAAPTRGDPRLRRLTDTLMASLLWTLVAEVFVSRQLSIPVWLIAALAGALRAEMRQSEAATPAEIPPEDPPEPAAAELPPLEFAPLR